MSGAPDHKLKPELQELLTKAIFAYKGLFGIAVGKCGGQARYVAQHTIVWQTSQKNEIHHQKGVCAGLAIEWIKARASGRDFVGELLKIRNEVIGKTNGKAEGWDGFAAQVSWSHEKQAQLGRALAGFTRKEDAGGQSPYPFKGIDKLLVPGCYHYISSGTHAMAAFLQGDKLDFYDPNVGEVAGTSKGFLEAYFPPVVQQTIELQKSGDANEKTMTISVFSK